jgi:hypothetical protein
MGNSSNRTPWTHTAKKNNNRNLRIHTAKKNNNRNPGTKRFSSRTGGRGGDLPVDSGEPDYMPTAIGDIGHGKSMFAQMMEQQEVSEPPGDPPPNDTDQA